MEFGPWDDGARRVIGQDVANAEAEYVVPDIARMFAGPGGLPFAPAGANRSQMEGEKWKGGRS